MSAISGQVCTFSIVPKRANHFIKLFEMAHKAAFKTYICEKWRNWAQKCFFCVFSRRSDKFCNLLVLKESNVAPIAPRMLFQDMFFAEQACGCAVI